LKKHEIDISGTKHEVFVKDVTFLDMQIAAQELMKGEGMDLPSYWKYAFSNWISIPPLTADEMMRLSPTAGKAISALVPSPEEMVEMLGFSKAESDL
tara:strand:- start:2644 stop:2934 length:291 start_codon:yes stop_codon:yes gene_type:complete